MPIFATFRREKAFYASKILTLVWVKPSRVNQVIFVEQGFATSWCNISAVQGIAYNMCPLIIRRKLGHRHLEILSFQKAIFVLIRPFTKYTLRCVIDHGTILECRNMCSDIWEKDVCKIFHRKWIFGSCEPNFCRAFRQFEEEIKISLSRNVTRMLMSFFADGTKRPGVMNKSVRGLLKNIPQRAISVLPRAKTIEPPMVIPQLPLGVCKPNEKQKPPLLAEPGSW